MLSSGVSARRNARIRFTSVSVNNLVRKDVN